MSLPDSQPNESTSENSSFLHVEKVNPKDKAAWVKAANKAGQKLGDWVIATLNAESQEDKNS